LRSARRVAPLARNPSHFPAGVEGQPAGVQSGRVLWVWEHLRDWWRQPVVRYTLVLFIGTRVALTIIGVLSRLALGPMLGHPVWEYSPHSWLSIWGVWDTGRYLDIAEHGYSTALTGGRPQPNYAFFPLYPLLIRLVGGLLGDTFVAGIIVSNLLLLLGSVLLYRLVRLDADEPTALRTVKYLFLFPSAFVLSGVFAESLFLALSVAAFFSARRGRWALAGLSGFLAALTRQIGVLIIIPLAYEYLRGVQWKPIRVRRDVLFLLLVPLGLATFALYTYYLTGDPLGIIRVRGLLGERLSNPLRVLVGAMFYGRAHLTFAGGFALAGLLLLGLFSQRIGFAYWFWGTCAILVPLTTGMGAILGVPRYMVPAFPLYIILAHLAGRSPTLDHALGASLVLLQGFLMAFWTTGSLLMI